MPYDYGIRKGLTEKGVNSADIGYNNGYVTLKGQNFMKPSKNYAGTSYDSKQNFDNAWNTYKGSTASATGITPTGVAGTSSAVNTGASLPAAGVTATGTAAPTTAATPTYTAPTYNDQVRSSIDALMNYKPQQVDPYSTDAYKAYQAQGDRQTHQGIRAAQEALGASGFGRSTTLGDRAQGIQNQEAEYLNTQVIPQIMAQEQAKQAQEYQNKVNMVNLLMQKQGQDQQFGIQQGQLTGTYITPDMQAAYKEVTDAKTAYALARTPEERAAARKAGDAGRAKLIGMGADASLVGADVTLDQARSNQSKFGVQTQDAIQNEWNRTHTESRDKVADQQWQDTFDQNNKVTMANLTGMIDGKLTTAEQQRQLENLWTVAGNTGIIPDKLADLYGIPHGTKTQAAYQFAKQLSIDWYNSQTSRMNANTNADQADLAWITADGKAAQGNAPEYSGLSAGQVLDAIQKRFTDPVTQTRIEGLTPDKIYQTVVSYGLPDGQDDQVMVSLGMTKQQIAEMDKKYAGN